MRGAEVSSNAAKGREKGGKSRAKVAILDKVFDTIFYLYEKLKQKGVILRSTKDGYGIKNKLRLTIGSNEENLKFMNTVKRILN